METFVVRVFVPASEERLELSGFVEHAGTGHAQSFTGADALIGVVLRRLELRREPAELPQPEREETR